MLKCSTAEALFVLRNEYQSSTNDEQKICYEMIKVLIRKYTDSLPRRISEEAQKQFNSTYGSGGKKLSDYTWAEQNVFDSGREIFVFEHVVPISVLAKNIVDNGKTLNDVVNILDKAEVAWILREEDASLNALKLRNKMSTISGSEYSLKNPLSRYITAGIVLV